MTRRSKTTKLQREAELSKKMAEYLTKTGFRSLGDALAFYAGSAAPPRSEGMIELRKVETGKLTVNPDRCSGASLADVADRFSPAAYKEYYDAAEAHPNPGTTMAIDCTAGICAHVRTHRRNSSAGTGRGNDDVGR